MEQRVSLGSLVAVKDKNSISPIDFCTSLELETSLWMLVASCVIYAFRAYFS